MEMNRFMHETGTTRSQCARVVTKNRRNALDNPSAPFAADLTIDDILSGPPLASPLGFKETAEHADGAIVMVLASEQVANSISGTPVWILGVGWSNDSAGLENRDWSSMHFIEDSARMAYRQAGIQDAALAIDFAEVTDLYAYKELQTLEALGIFRAGESGPATEDGITQPNGAFPVNVSGGCLGVGNLLDANGLARALEVVLQLRGDAGSRQLNKVNIGLAQSWRGVPTASGAVAILGN
jgi:acetyl-CoA C-acetyltransferase